MIKKVHKTDAEWSELLTPDQYRVMRQQSTEAPLTCELNQYKGDGVFYRAACGLPLFKSRAKFESGTGWPSFYEPYVTDHLIVKDDEATLLSGIEVLCAHCESYLGHVFGDGPPPTGKRYCINGTAPPLAFWQPSRYSMSRRSESEIKTLSTLPLVPR